MNSLDIASVQNSQRGDVFIVASGPSAREFPLMQYSHIPMLALNGSVRLFDETGISPFFYMCDDGSFVRNRLPLLLRAVEISQNLALSPGVIDNLLRLQERALDDVDVYRFERVNRPGENKPALSDRCFAWRARQDSDMECHFSLLRQKPNRIGFCRNLAKGYFSGRTIPYAGIQLAYHLGFSRVFLVGVDLDSSLGRFYEQGADAVPSRLDGDYLDYILPCFQLMARRVLGEHFAVYNLSLNSRLPADLIPKIGIDQLDGLLVSS